MPAINHYKKCPLDHQGMLNIHLCDYDHTISYDSFAWWRCKECHSEFRSEVGDSLESFIPKKNKKKYQEMIAGVTKLTETKLRNDIEDYTKQETVGVSLSIQSTATTSFTDARNCPFCKEKLITSFYIDPDETFTRNFDGWLCLSCDCRFSPQVWNSLEIQPDNSAELYGFTEWEISDDSLIVDPESIVRQMDLLAVQEEPRELYIIRGNGQPMQYIHSLDELV